MANLRDIKKRIVSVKSTQKITKAMKMVSASKLRRFQERFEAITRCESNLQRMIAECGSTLNHPFLKQRSVGRRAILVITSDRGLCGGFNSNLTKYAIKTISQIETDGYDLFTIGRKGRDLLRRRGFPSKHDYDLKKAETGEIDEIYRKLEADYLSCSYRSIEVVSSEFQSSISSKPTMRTLLPITLNSESERIGDVIFEPSRERVMTSLLSYYFYLSLLRCLNESFSCEFGARMAAMENATKNAGEMIDNLTLKYNRTRQAAITKELIEIISGAETTG